MHDIVILDYGIGNVRSILNAIEGVGGKATISRDETIIRECKGLIIPGVGAFQQGMENLHQANLVGLIQEVADSGKPILGICLGMQLMLTQGTENGTIDGLNLIPGIVEKMPLTVDNVHRLPHVGWNAIYPPETDTWAETVLSDEHKEKSFYFVHSYVAKPDDNKHILAKTRYGDCEFVSAIRKDNIVGCQFHPEKSADLGLLIIKNFIKSL